MSAESPAPESPLTSGAGSGSVLVVDDEVSLRLVAERSMRRAGFRCKSAENGRAALDLIDGGFDCDVVITDLRMPVMDGYDLCMDLLNRPEPPAMIVLTGVLEAAAQADLEQRGVVRFFFKPVSYREVASVVAEAVAARQASG